MTQAAYKRYLLTLLLVIMACNFADRSALGLLLQDVKVDLGLSDTQLGLLTGIAFALFYAAMGIPIARWADRGNRVTIIALSAVLGSVMVAWCGLAATFAQLLLIRIGVAVGEAGCMPASNSLIAHYFARGERPRATGIYLLGGPLSVVIGFFVAGWLNEFYGWRTTFILLSLPGIALAALAWFTLREPRSMGLPAVVPAAATPVAPFATPIQSALQPSFWQVCTILQRSRTFRHVLLCFAVVYFFGYGIGKWQPAFFIRSHGLQTGELGTWLALIHGVGGFLGTYLGGELASRHAPSNERLQLKAMAIAYVGSGVISAGVYLSPGVHLSFAFLLVATLVATMANGPLFATIQTLVPERMRAVSLAIVFLFANLIGLGLGPLAAGVLSDALRPLLGEESLRYALLALCPGYLWCAWHAWRASRTVTRDVQALQHAGHCDFDEGALNRAGADRVMLKDRFGNLVGR